MRIFSSKKFFSISLKMRFVTVKGSQKYMFPTRRTGKEVVLAFEDNGIGIPGQDKERIFTRGFGKNTGYGLFLAREILAITGITIKETGKVGKGARVRNDDFGMCIPVW